MRSARESSLHRLMTHPVTALLAGVLSMGVLAVITTRPTRGAGVPVEVARAECYRMIYAEPVGGASVDHFPARVILLPGIDSGAVRLEGSSSRGIWWTFAAGSMWRAIGRDSIALDLTNGRAHIDARARRALGRLSGRATYRANLAAPVSPPSMRFVGEVETGKTATLRAITYDLRDEAPGEASCTMVRSAAG
jgi:hypothetical protein